MSRYSKAIAALLGGLTPAVVMGVLAVLGVHVDPTLAAGICTVVSAIATVLAPPNTVAPQISPAAPPQG